MEILDLGTWVGVLAGGAILTLPGAALYVLSARILGIAQTGAGSSLLFGLGLSVAFWPLLLFYVTLLGLQFTSLLIWAVLLLSMVALVWSLLRGYIRLPTARSALVTGLTLAIMSLMALLFRLGDIAGLALPIFGDSLHHTMVATIIADTGRVPSGYQPYVPVDTFTYHFGFHTLAATLAQLTDLPVPQAVLLMGQLLITAAVPMSFLFGRGLTGSNMLGLCAALITGFVSVMPGYYMNFGRYTQLSGLVLLPAALVLLTRAASRDYRRHELFLPYCCGAWLMVVHYRILIFFALFALALLAQQLLTHRQNWRELIHPWVRVTLVVVAGLLATAPWIWNLLTNYVSGLLSRLSTASPDYLASYNSLENFRSYVGWALAALGAAGLILAILTLRAGGEGDIAPDQDVDAGAAPAFPPYQAALLVAGWAALIVVSIWFPPGAIGSLTASLSLYLPLSFLGGYALTWALLAAGGLRVRARPTLLAPALILAAWLCAWFFGTIHLADPGRWSYVREGDLQAFRWAASNTPPGSRFLVSSQISYAGRAVTASDAGMWLPLIAGRNVSVPALASWTEHPIEEDYFTNARELAALTQPPDDPEVQRLLGAGRIPQPLGPSDPRVLHLMQEMGITHVFSGTEGGASKPRLDIAAMRRDGCHYKLIYPPTEGVYIFEVSYSECE